MKKVTIKIIHAQKVLFVKTVAASLFQRGQEAITEITGRPGIRLRKYYGSGSGMGEKKWRMGDHPPLQEVWSVEFQSGGGRR